MNSILKVLELKEDRVNHNKAMDSLKAVTVNNNRAMDSLKEVTVNNNRVRDSLKEAMVNHNKDMANLNLDNLANQANLLRNIKLAV